MMRRLEIDAGHRLINHEGKCANYHGHRYVIEITCAADTLDVVGRIVDFSVVKSVVGGWLDTELDHGMILQRGDPAIGFMRDNGSKVHVVNFPPTAEHLSRYILDVASHLLRLHNVTVTCVRVYETPNCFSESRP